MRITETVTYLEMTAREQLRPSRPSSIPLSVVKVGVETASSYRSTYDRIAAELSWQSRRAPPWTSTEWSDLLSDPEVHGFLAFVGDELAGILELATQPDGDVEVGVFGLLPEFIGRGLGGWFLTRAVGTAWDIERRDRLPVSRLWLHTSTRDHPHAQRNYQRRGFRVVRVVSRERDIMP